MNTVYLLLAFLISIGNLFSQELNCLDYKLYNSDFDAIQIDNQTESDVIISETDLKDETLQLIVFPNSYSEYPRRSNHYENEINEGYKILLINNSEEEDYSIFNRDGKIIMYREVFYKNEWRKVKSYKKTFYPSCGNSFMNQKIIYSKNHFTFIAPCLEGDINVKFRFIIALKDGSEYILVYSNEFDGFINKSLIE